MAKASPPEAEVSAELLTVVLDVDIDESYWTLLSDAPMESAV
jgi:hypothetical protein